MRFLLFRHLSVFGPYGFAALERELGVIDGNCPPENRRRKIAAEGCHAGGFSGGGNRQVPAIPVFMPEKPRFFRHIAVIGA
ncbi:hypothetical protein [Paracoccus sp. SM22M-07]|uniref:hypothetical protein n=1 Tax=Paracoccus sp. SM22M-07 TaxID=1520813 RepID=UPI0011147F76|nr:hypothetical protein [Paracoccus sp. SM22M-07]